MSKFNKKANAKLAKRQADHDSFISVYSKLGLAPRFLGGFKRPGSTNRHQG